MSSGIVLLGHGTKDTEGVAEFLALAGELRRQTEQFVAPGVLEYPNDQLPDVLAAFDSLVGAGLDDVTVLPALLFFAGHTGDDLPSVLNVARSRHPNLKISVAGPLGLDQRLLRVLEDRLGEFAQDASTAVLLVGRGSLDSEANADLYKTARMLWDRNAYGWVEAAFVSVAEPYVAAGIERCVRLGAHRIVVVPYFLNTGVLVKRISQQAYDAEAEVHVASHLGLHPLVFDILRHRLRQAREGVCPCQAGTGCRMPNLPCERGAACLNAA